MEGLTQGKTRLLPICPPAKSEMFAINLIRSHRRARGRKASRVHLFRILSEVRQPCGASPSSIAQGETGPVATGGDGASTVRLYPRVLPLPAASPPREVEAPDGRPAEQAQLTPVPSAETLDACFADDCWVASLTDPDTKP